MNKNPNQSGLKPHTAKTPSEKAGPGRPKGSPNKNNLVRSWIEENYNGGVEGYVENILTTIEQIQKPDEKARLLLQLLEFIAPKLKSIDSTLSMDPDSGQITIVYATATKPKPDIEA